MAIPILKNWRNYFINPDEGLGSSYERIVLNNKLDDICRLFEIQKVLEAPSFGFTGLSGINSMNLALGGKEITLLDHDQDRIEKIKSIWKQVKQQVEIQCLSSYSPLPFANDLFDLSWNFSALWFVDDLTSFLQELIRVTRKAILLAVPNRTGLGYLSQRFSGKDELKNLLKEENISPKNILKIMKQNNWLLIDHDYIDCPPWPDIGMPKEKFLKKLGIPVKDTETEPISILDFYLDKKPDFPEQMMKYFWFERSMPHFIKAFWAHHKYFLFIPQK